MGADLSKDVIPLTDLKKNAGKVVKRVVETHRPVHLTSRGREVAVIQSLSKYNSKEQERQFVRGVVQGVLDLESGREHELSEVRERLERN